MQFGCDADVAAAAMGSTDTAQTLAANAACWHSHNSASTHHTMWWRWLRRREEVRVIGAIILRAGRLHLTVIKFTNGFMLAGFMLAGINRAAVGIHHVATD